MCSRVDTRRHSDPAGPSSRISSSIRLRSLALGWPSSSIHFVRQANRPSKRSPRQARAPARMRLEVLFNESEECHYNGVLILDRRGLVIDDRDEGVTRGNDLGPDLRLLPEFGVQTEQGFIETDRLRLPGGRDGPCKCGHGFDLIRIMDTYFNGNATPCRKPMPAAIAARPPRCAAGPSALPGRPAIVRRRRSPESAFRSCPARSSRGRVRSPPLSS